MASSLESWTAQEKEAWNSVKLAAHSCLELPELHHMEREELCHAFHQIQNYLLGRPLLRALYDEDEV